MTGWRLSPAGIQGVLDTVNAEAEGLVEFLSRTGIAAGCREAVTAGLGSEAAVLAPVLQAVQASLDAQAGSARSISNRIDAGVLGVLNATMAYNQGNEEMAGQFQAAAATAADTGVFVYFTAFGVR